jgi:hypothetical protein
MSFTSILSAIAPELEAALPLVGGPFGAVASMALKAVSGVVTPTDPSPTVDKVLAALHGATPEQLAAIQKANDDFKLKTEQLGIDTLQIKADLEAKEAADDAADRASARASFIAVKFIPQMVLSAVFIAGYFFISGFLVYELFTGQIKLIDVNPAVLTLVTTLVGVLTASVVQIVNFWFGSSHGSQKKDAALAQAATL